MSFFKRYPLARVPLKSSKAFENRLYSPPLPVIPVKLSFGIVDTPIILPVADSGSNYCYFSNELIDVLQLKKNNGKEDIVTGVGNATVKVLFFNIEIKILDPDTKQVIYKFPCYAGFTEGSIPFGGLLGMSGFYDRFMVYFNVPQNYFELHAKR